MNRPSISVPLGTSASASPRFAPSSRVERLLCGLAIAIGLIGAVAFWAARGSLWEDEVIAITHGLQPLSSFVSEMLRNDIHPPTWFLLLKGWTAWAPGSDAWALASSLVLALAAAWTVHRVTLRHDGPSAALWACALYVVQPTFAWSAGTLRMYSLVPLLAVLSWHLGRRLIQGGSTRVGVVLVTVQLLLAYSHAIEFLFVGLIALNVLWVDWSRSDRAGRWRWARWQALTLVGMTWLPLSALSRGTEPLPPSHWTGLFHNPASMIAGWSLESDSPFLIAGGLVFLGMAALALRTADGRRILLGLPVLGLLAALGIGMFGKPLYKTPVFAANLLPFLAIAAGLGAARLGAPAARAGAALLLLCLAATTLPWSQRQLPPENYAPAGRAIAAAVRPGDLVVVPNVSVYWGVMRYATTPQWGRPLEILPPDNASWQALKRKLGPDWVRCLSLTQTGDRVEFNGVTYVIGEPRDLALAPGGSLWVVQRARYASSVGLTTPARVTGTEWFGKELSVQRLQADPTGTTTVSNPDRP
ncbi:MAG: hypothetical protein EOP37_21535 [Rubrivivax sp.]|nr:MAG: hypothetical protein EOP37_21535 [Rubrivivax sp.]